MRALQENIKSTAMSKAINKLFIAIVAFIASAGSYMKHNKLRTLQILEGLHPRLVHEELIILIQTEWLHNLEEETRNSRNI